VLAIAFSPDGKLFVSAGQDEHSVRLSRLVALHSERPALDTLGRLDGPTGLCALAFSPDGKRLAGATRDLVKLWDHEARLEMLTLRGSPQRYWDGPFAPRLAFSRDGAALAGTNWDESVSLWEADSKSSPTEALRRQARRLAEQRAAFWHLQEAEQCLRFRNLGAARFHANRLAGAPLPPPLEARRKALENALAAPPE
jgi:WD40 repeat protein